MSNQSSVLVSNLPGERRMLDVVRDAMGIADAIAISVSFLRCSGLGLVADEFKQMARRGGRVRFLTSTYLGVTQPEALRALRSLPGVEAKLHVPGSVDGAGTGFHTKLYVFHAQRSECWVGSSNFSKGGLATNIEANLRHLGNTEVAAAEGLFEQLWRRPGTFDLDEEVIARYESWRPAQARFAAPPVSASSMGALPASSLATRIADEGSAYPRTLALPGLGASGAPVPNAAQREALSRLASLRESGESRAVVIAAPGIGKTFLSAFDAQASGVRSVLFLSHRLEHLTQAERTFRQVFGDDRAYGQMFGGQSDGQADFVFATIRSATNSSSIENRKFDYVVVDEFHHAAASSYVSLIERLRPTFLLGLTATPERQDGHDVLRLCDFNVAYEIRLVEAINRRWLLPFHYFGIADSTVDYSAIPWRSGRFDPEALDNALMIEARVDEMLRVCLERGFDGPRRATVGFCAGVKHAEFMAQALVRRGMGAACVTGATPVEAREAVYRRFADPNDDLEWLFVADVLNEGVDIPAINSIVFLRPTESATIFIQQLGRGLRLSPDCEVLTVIDLVGHHRSAWLTVETLGDRDAPAGPSTLREFDLTPPRSCEIVLDARTKEILEKVRRQSASRKDQCLEAYRVLREVAGVERPYPKDLLSQTGLPGLADVRAAFGSWVGLRRAYGDAQSWELDLDESAAAFTLLAAAERDWQAARVYGYAALWGMCAVPDDPSAGYEKFFERFPRWSVEYKPLSESKVAGTLAKKLGALYAEGRLIHEAYRGIPRDLLMEEIEGRLQYMLEKDYRLRHGGVLRTPEDLEVHRHYDRPEIVNHFGEQYDPARHNLGVLRFGKGPANIAILSKLDTSGAIDRHQYSNQFDGSARFIWTSQNRQTQGNESGLEILEHRRRGTNIHLFVQSGSHAKAVYCGEVQMEAVEGNGPMKVTFGLLRPVPDSVLRSLGAT